MINEILIGLLFIFAAYRVGYAVGVLRTLKAWKDFNQEDQKDFSDWLTKLSTELEERSKEEKND